MFNVSSNTPQYTNKLKPSAISFFISPVDYERTSGTEFFPTCSIEFLRISVTSDHVWKSSTTFYNMAVLELCHCLSRPFPGFFQNLYLFRLIPRDLSYILLFSIHFQVTRWHQKISCNSNLLPNLLNRLFVLLNLVFKLGFGVTNIRNISFC